MVRSGWVMLSEVIRCVPRHTVIVEHLMGWSFVSVRIIQLHCWKPLLGNNGFQQWKYLKNNVWQ
jgi:hypothetical protein